GRSAKPCGRHPSAGIIAGLPIERQQNGVNHVFVVWHDPAHGFVPVVRRKRAPAAAVGRRSHTPPPRRMVMMRAPGRFSLSLLAAALAVGLLVPLIGGAQPKPLKPYTLILDFVPTGEYVPHYTALEKGFYRDEGLDVKIVRGQGSGDTVKRIAAGQGDV